MDRIKPIDLCISIEEFDNLVMNAEVEFMKNRASESPAERSSCVQMWVKIDKKLVPDNYLELLKINYKESGWTDVEVKWVTDRTESLYIYLSI